MRPGAGPSRHSPPGTAAPRERTAPAGVPTRPGGAGNVARVTTEAGGKGRTRGSAAGGAPSPGGPLRRSLAATLAPATVGDATWWLVLAAVGFLVGQIAALVLIDIGALATGNAADLNHLLHELVPPEWLVVAGLLGTWIGFAGAPVLASRTRGTRSLVADFGLRFRWIDLLGIPIGVAAQYAIEAAYLPFSHHISNFTKRMGEPAHQLTGSSHGVGFVLVGIFLVLGAPFCEELFFRGLVLRGLLGALRKLGVAAASIVAAVATGAIFGAVHDESLQFFGLAAFGILLSFLALGTRRLGMGMLAHASFNLVSVVSIAASGVLR